MPIDKIARILAIIEGGTAACPDEKRPAESGSFLIKL